jgi:hypothetical protein
MPYLFLQRPEVHCIDYGTGMRYANRIDRDLKNMFIQEPALYNSASNSGRFL